MDASPNPPPLARWLEKWGVGKKKFSFSQPPAVRAGRF
jgi:hypothetical protein